MNLGFHHLADGELLLHERKLLGLGHKFIPTSYEPSASGLQRGLSQFNRRVLIRDFFAQLADSNDAGPAPDIRLRTANPLWHPLKAYIGDAPYVPTPAVQEFLDEFGREMMQTLGHLKDLKIRDNLTRDERIAINTLLGRSDMVFLEADKARGLVLKNTADYRTEGRAELQLTYREIPPAEFNSESADELESAVMLHVRQKFIAVLNKHGDLINSWKGTALHWKYKYLTAAADLHPQTRKKYRPPYARFSPKLEKPGNRMIVASHQWIGQPFALLIAIEMQPQIAEIPSFLKDADEMIRQIEELRLPRDVIFITQDVEKLYPNIDLDDCMIKQAEYQAERWTDEHDPEAMQADELTRDLTEVILRNQYVSFDGAIWLARTGFPIGSAFGREMAEMYMHMLERDLLLANKHNILWSRRFVDDIGTIWRGSQAEAELFRTAYNSLHRTINLTGEISDQNLVMLDADIHKGEHFAQSGQLDVRLFEKKMAAHLYIPPQSEHPAAVIRASVKGNLIRLVKRSSLLNYFLADRANFYRRLRARKFGHSILQKEFAKISWSDRWKFLHFNPAKKRLGRTQNNPKDAGPVTLALTLPYTQRTAALHVERALFSTSKRLLVENDKVPETLRTARYRLAQKMGTKLGQQLLTTRFPPKKRIPPKAD